MISRNDLCWCGSGIKWKKCHYPEEKPNGSGISSKNSPEQLRELYKKQYKIILKNKQEIDGIRTACKLASKILVDTCRLAKAGVTTDELNSFAHEEHIKAGAIPAPLHYGHPPFPKSICTSINEVICHGIPGSRKLKDGDIVNIDVSPIYNGYYGDCSCMVMIGEVNQERKLVVDTAYECLMRSIKVLKPGILLSKIGEEIQSYAEGMGCSVVTDFVGHGVGINFHEAPQVPHYRTSLHIPLAPGMIFTIEPMINAGVKDAVVDASDGWTAKTKDNRASAQWEHTILITDNGHEILTTWKREDF